MKTNKEGIIILYNWYYPAYKAGGPILSLVNLTEQLKAELDVKVICSNEEYDGTLLDVPFDRWVKIKGIDVYYNSKTFHGIKSATIKRGVLFINGMYSLVYNLYPAIFLKGRKIISVRGMLHPEGLAEKEIKKRLYLFSCKMLGLHKRCEFHATSEKEKQYIQNVFGSKSKVWVIQNFPNILEYETCTQKDKDKLRIATIALISPMKNHMQVLLALKQCNAEISYEIYGPVKDESYWISCQEVIKELPSNISVIYHGAITPDKLDDAFSKIHLYIQPSKSENFGHSLFEALSKGRPIITSNSTPWNGLQNSMAGINIDPLNITQLANGIIFFAAMNSEEFIPWCEGAKRFSEKAIDIAGLKKQYLNMFTSK